MPIQDFLNHKFICNSLQYVALIYDIAKLFHAHVEHQTSSIISNYILQDDLEVFKVIWNFRQLWPFELAKFRTQTCKDFQVFERGCQHQPAGNQIRLRKTLVDLSLNHNPTT